MRSTYEILAPNGDIYGLRQGRSNLKFPTTVWVQDLTVGGPMRPQLASCVVELSVALRWRDSWTRPHRRVLLEPCAELTAIPEPDLPGFSKSGPGVGRKN